MKVTSHRCDYEGKAETGKKIEREKKKTRIRRKEK